uniref:Uncharacterized protein n=1 Tax=Rhizophora mucronata TaxID=61149 RepID=A0A2P2NWK0_RHIMU
MVWMMNLILLKMDCHKVVAILTFAASFNQISYPRDGFHPWICLLILL